MSAFVKRFARPPPRTMLTANRLRKLLTYNPRTGVFRWRVPLPGRKEGNVAGATRQKGRLIRVDRRQYPAGRLAWLYMKGRWPKYEINFINGDRSDVRWANLREITRSQKRTLSAPFSKLGVKGVWKTTLGKYAAEIRVAGEKTYLGHFDTLGEASRAYAKAARKAFGSFARAW